MLLSMMQDWLKKLKKVNLSYNSIENFDSIVDNQELEYLDVSHNNVNNISTCVIFWLINN